MLNLWLYKATYNVSLHHWKAAQAFESDEEHGINTKSFSTEIFFSLNICYSVGIFKYSSPSEYRLLEEPEKQNNLLKWFSIARSAFVRNVRNCNTSNGFLTCYTKMLLE